MQNKKLLIAIIIIGALLLTSVFGAGIIIAQTSGKHFSLHSLYKKLGHGFGAKKHKKFNEKSKLEWLSKNLDKAVKEGKITKQQKQTFLAKNAEMTNKMKELKSSGGSWQEMKKLKKDFMKWAEDNDIDLSDIYGKKGKWKKHGKWKKGSHDKNLHYKKF